MVGNTALCLRNPVARAPIGISDEARGYPLVHKPIQVLLIGDPSENLPGARQETEQIANAYAGHAEIDCTTLIGSEATFDRVVRELLRGNYDVVHFAGHAWYDAQEAYLALHDNTKFRANELRSLLSPRPPAILLLNSHYTAFIPPGVRIDEQRPPTIGGEESMIDPAIRGKGGFTEVAATAGVGALIGCFGSPDDQLAADIGIDVHVELLKGTPVAVALHKARLASLAKDPADKAGMLYILSGYPELALY